MPGDVVRPVSARSAALNRWVVGARPRTLPAAVVPVALGVGCAAGVGPISWWRAALALVVSLALQVGVNYANDYSDGVRGTDDVRVGPVRLVASGLAAPGGGQAGGAARLRRGRRGRVGARRVDVVVAAGGRAWRASPRRGDTPAARGRMATSDSARCSCSCSSASSPRSGTTYVSVEAITGLSVVDRVRRRVRGLRPARRQQPARHPDRPAGGQAHARRAPR